MSDRLAAAVAELVDALREELAAATPVDAPERLLSIPEAAEALGIGRTRLYAELEAGRLRGLHVGRRHLVSASAVAEYAARQA